MSPGIFPATVFSLHFLQVWCHHRDYYSLFNLSDQLHFLQISSFVVRSFSPYPGENDLRRKRNEKYWLSVGYVLIRCFLFQERTVKTIKWWRRNGESKNISSRPKRLKKFMQTRIKTKKNSRKSNPYPFIYHFSRKRYPFHIPSISDKWCPFHIRCLELRIPFDCCKSNECTVFFT